MLLLCALQLALRTAFGILRERACAAVRLELHGDRRLNGGGVASAEGEGQFSFLLRARRVLSSVSASCGL